MGHFLQDPLDPEIFRFVTEEINGMHNR